MNARTLARLGAVLLGPLLLGVCGMNGAAHAAGAASPDTGALAGPFEILIDSRRVSAPGPDMRPFQTRLAHTFRLRHSGRPVPLDRGDHGVATGRAAVDPVFDRAYYLDAAQRSVLVATPGQTFLLHERDGRPVATRLAVEGFTAMQWLDSEAGQPGDKRHPLADLRTETRTLAGGRLLLLYGAMGDKLGVLDTASRVFHPLAFPTPASGPSGAIFADGYRDDGGRSGRVRALSPSRTQFVQLGMKYVGDRRQDALIVVDFVQRSHVVVALDVDATRLNDHRKLTPAWLLRNFDWAASRDSRAGSERLVARRGATPAPWTGVLADANVEPAGYRVQPVTPAMQAALLAYLVARHGAVVVPASGAAAAGEDRVRIGGDLFDLNYRPDDQVLSFTQALGTYSAEGVLRCSQVGAGFDVLLAGGAHQALFTRLASHQIESER